MLVALIIVVSLLAVVFLALFLTTRSSAAEYRQQADRRESDLQAERDRLTADKSGLETELKAAGREQERLTETVNSSKVEVRRLGGELDKARSVAQQQSAKIASLSETIESRTETIETKTARIEEVEGEVVALQAQIEVAETAAASAMARASGIVIGEMEDGGARPETLWNLELTRSERTWRTSVSINPEADHSPFDDADDPARLAVEIEAAALRENVGAAINVDWQASAVEDATQRHLIVRVAQELLESAARSPEPSVLQAVDGDDGEIVLSLTPLDESTEVINIIPPRITSDLLDFRDETGLSVTVKAQ